MDQTNNFVTNKQAKPSHPPPTHTNTNTHSHIQRKRNDSLEGTVLTHLEPTYRQTDRKTFGSTHEPLKNVCDNFSLHTHTHTHKILIPHRPHMEKISIQVRTLVSTKLKITNASKLAVHEIHDITRPT